MRDNQTVSWRLTVHGVFVTPMDFARFPFDRQHLIVQLSTTQPDARRVQLVPSATAREVRGGSSKRSGWILGWELRTGAVIMRGRETPRR